MRKTSTPKRSLFRKNEVSILIAVIVAILLVLFALARLANGYLAISYFNTEESTLLRNNAAQETIINIEAEENEYISTHTDAMFIIKFPLETTVILIALVFCEYQLLSYLAHILHVLKRRNFVRGAHN